MLLPVNVLNYSLERILQLVSASQQLCIWEQYQTNKRVYEKSLRKPSCLSNPNLQSVQKGKQNQTYLMLPVYASVMQYVGAA